MNQVRDRDSALEQVRSRLAEKVRTGQPALSIFTMAGFPDRDATAEVLLALQEAGVDFVELGLPFSDPMADGPIIQAAAQQALDRGFRLDELFALLEGLRPQLRVPVFFMGYFNTVFSLGVEAFFERCAQLGIAGLIVPDWPLEEQAPYRALAQRLGLGLVQLVAPNTSLSRIRQLDAASDPFLYCVSYTGTTGQFGRTDQRVQDYLEKVRRVASKPLMVGFGVQNSTDVARLVPPASGVIVGSAFLKTLQQAPEGGWRGVTQRFVGSLLPEDQIRSS